MVKKTTSIRLDDDSQKLLAALSADMGGLSQSDIVRFAIRELAKARGLVAPTKVKK